MRAGELRKRITIKAISDTQDARGGPTKGESTHATRWARIRPLVGRERFAAQRVDAEVDYEILLRYVSGVTPKMRVYYGARVFEIRAVMNTDERNRELKLLCAERV